MLPWETLRARDDRRARRRTDLAALEQLEGRQLLSYSSLGYSLPDLKISGLAGPVASWGGTYQVTVVLQNTGASTIIEPLSLVPASEVAVGPDGSPVPPYYVPSSADAAASQVGIYLAPRPHSLAGAIEIGTATAPAITQNDIERFNVSLTLPQRPAGFRATGVYYIRLVANQTNSVLESSFSNNLSAPIPVRFISPAAATAPGHCAGRARLDAAWRHDCRYLPDHQPGHGAHSIPNGRKIRWYGAGGIDDAHFNVGGLFRGCRGRWQATFPGQSTLPCRPVGKRFRSSILNSDNNNVHSRANVETFSFDAVTFLTVPVYSRSGLLRLDPATLHPPPPVERLELIRTVGPGDFRDCRRPAWSAPR